MEQEANHIVVFDTFERQTEMLLVACTRMISILTGFMGYGLGIGIAGLIGGRLSRKVQPGEKRNGTGRYDFIRNRNGGIDYWNNRAVLCLFKSEWSLCRYDDEWCEVILRQIS